MIEVNINDRIPTFPGRVRLTPVPGEDGVFDLERADAPTETGTPISKATLDSIIKSRLTGRYYMPTVFESTIGEASGLSEYGVTTFYREEFTQNEGFPATFSQGQRVTIQTPSGYTTAGVTENYINGIKINTILKPSRRYELVYASGSFDATEV